MKQGILFFICINFVLSMAFTQAFAQMRLQQAALSAETQNLVQALAKQTGRSVGSVEQALNNLVQANPSVLSKSLNTTQVVDVLRHNNEVRDQLTKAIRSTPSQVQAALNVAGIRAQTTLGLGASKAKASWFAKATSAITLAATLCVSGAPGLAKADECQAPAQVSADDTKGRSEAELKELFAQWEKQANAHGGELRETYMAMLQNYIASSSDPILDAGIVYGKLSAQSNKQAVAQGLPEGVISIRKLMALYFVVQTPEEKSSFLQAIQARVESFRFRYNDYKTSAAAYAEFLVVLAENTQLSIPHEDRNAAINELVKNRYGIDVDTSHPTYSMFWGRQGSAEIRSKVLDFQLRQLEKFNIEDLAKYFNSDAWQSEAFSAPVIVGTSISMNQLIDGIKEVVVSQSTFADSLIAKKDTERALAALTNLKNSSIWEKIRKVLDRNNIGDKRSNFGNNYADYHLAQITQTIVEIRAGYLASLK